MGEGDREDAGVAVRLLALKMEERASEQDSPADSGGRNREGLQKSHSPTTMDFSSLRFTRALEFQNCKGISLCWFKPLNPW